MSFIVFVLLFVVLCGWLDARIDDRRTDNNTAAKMSSQSLEER
jgi:lipopolysaccharide biosynthesis regulator YciM